MRRTPDLWTRGANVRLEQGDAVDYRPALFVFLHDDGTATWVDPSYLDPWGAGTPAAHSGRVREIAADGSITIEGGGWTALVFELAADDDLPVVEQAIAKLEARGSTWAAEREAVQQLLAE